MANKGTIRFGLLGAGLVAQFHAKAIQAAAGCELVAVADPIAERVKLMVDRFGCGGCSLLDELLADETIDVINVLTPNHLHCDATLAAAKAGKHVLVEKPPAMSLADVDRMIAACDRAGVKLGVVLNCRVRKAVQAMKSAMAEGRFGKLLRADANMKWYRTTEYYLSDGWRSSRRSGAGVTVQHAFHYIDLLLYLMGPAARVQARMTNAAHPQVQLEDTLAAFIDFSNGSEGTVVASTALWPGMDVRIELYGEAGTAIMVGERMDTWVFRDERPGDEEIRSLGRGVVATGATGPAALDFADHQVVIEGMAAAVRDDVDPIVSAGSARVTLEAVLAMYQSAASGQAVELPVENEELIWQ
ncbi:MAG: Gfo/Idh/MocA family oxidoreductase [Planctomycetes bacterium]|nr:Gfo/Idh/MocA family oxidoreductase [Planctomycetota bacterium]